MKGNIFAKSRERSSLKYEVMRIAPSIAADTSRICPNGWFFDSSRRSNVFPREYRRHPIEYFHRFYGDTVTSGSTPALMCGYSFFGADHILFGTDMPYDEELGLRGIKDTIRAIEQMEISEAERVKIFEGNARTLLRLLI